MLLIVREKYLSRIISLHFVRVPSNISRKRKLVWSSVILVLRIYWDLSSLRPEKAVGRPFCENFLILVKCPLDSRRKSDWFRCEKISQKLKYLNFKCEQSERYFFVLFCSVLFITLRISHEKNFAGDKRKAWVKIMLDFYSRISLVAGGIFVNEN